MTELYQMFNQKFKIYKVINKNTINKSGKKEVEYELILETRGKLTNIKNIENIDVITSQNNIMNCRILPTDIEIKQNYIIVYDTDKKNLNKAYRIVTVNNVPYPVNNEDWYIKLILQADNTYKYVID
jgi:hypothetical protein